MYCRIPTEVTKDDVQKRTKFEQQQSAHTHIVKKTVLRAIKHYFQINFIISEMSSDTEIFIKAEMDESQEMHIENIEQFIKVEVDENVAFDGDIMNKSQEIEENVLGDEKRTGVGLTAEELKHIEWLKMKTQSLDSMKGKYNSQLQEYLRLAELRKTAKDLPRTYSHLGKEEINKIGTSYEEIEEKTIIPSRKRQQSKRAERADKLKESITKRKILIK